MDGYETGDWPALPPMSALVNRVHCMDAIELMKMLPDESVDLFFTDPPYNLGYRYHGYNDHRPDDEYLDWCYLWLTEAIRVLKPTGSLFLLHIPKYAIDLAAFLKKSLVFQHWITWDAMSKRATKPLMPAHYALLYFTKSDMFTVNEVRSKHQRCRNCGEMVADYGGKKHLAHAYGPVLSDVWTDIGRAKHKQRGGHPCKLPEKLVDRVLKIASNPGDLIVDPFVGTGTTAIVATKLGRQFIVGDGSPKYCDMAWEGLSQTNLPMLLETTVSSSAPVALPLAER